MQNQPPQESAKRVSVVIPCYNAAHVIGEQLDALCEQVDAPPFEVILADNGSSDDLRSAVEPYLQRLDLRVVDASQRQGAAYARNVGVREAQGEYILFCDADDVVVPEWVAKLHEPLLHGKTFTTGSSCLWDGRRETMAEARKHASTGLYTKGTYFPSAGSGNAAYPRDAYVRLGGMEMGFRGGCEDVDLSWRLQENGYELVFVPEACMFYRSRSTLRSAVVQNYRFSREDVRLWALTKQRGHESYLVSMSGAVKRLAQLPGHIARAPRSRDDAERIGNIIGALAGNVVYRVRKRSLDARLASPSWFDEEA